MIGDGGKPGTKGTTRDWNATSHTQVSEVVPVQVASGERLPSLVVLSGQHVGQIFPLSDSQVVIGRSNDAGITILDDSISRFHAVVYRDDEGSFRVRDLGSTNGSFVNSTRADDTRLISGDIVQLGRSTLFKFEYHRRVDAEFHARLYDAGTRDSLTGALNRRYFDQHLEADFRLALRHGEEFSVAIVDIDHFKAVNDSHGHLAGDEVLRNLVGTLQARLRGEDILARYGGEEFVLLLRRTSAEGAGALALSLREIVEASELRYHGAAIPITVSIGVATLTHPPRYWSPGELLAAADAALYRAKAAGRNRVVVEGGR